MAADECPTGLAADECPVCLNVPNRWYTFETCDHRICESCAFDTLASSGFRCHFCRAVVAGLHPDSSADEEAGKVPIDVSFSVGNGVHAGVTLKDAPRGGVRVIAMHEEDEASRHLRIGDVIEFINGLPAATHRDAVNIINAATEHALGLRLTVSRNHRASKFSCAPRSAECNAELIRLRRLAASHHSESDVWVNGHTNP